MKPIDLPDGWRAKLTELLQLGGIYQNEAEFCEATPSISVRTIARAEEVGRMTQKSALLLCEKLGYTSISALVAALTPSQTRFPWFRDVKPKFWQEIRFEERPHPFPPPDSSKLTPPFSEKPSGEYCHVGGWHLYLLKGARYKVTCDFVHNDVWPEIEIVVYVRVPHTQMWKRGESFGAVTTDKTDADVIPQIEETFITVWGKTVSARDAPWFDFTPATSDLKVKADGCLKLRFSAPNRQHGGAGYPESASKAESSPEVQLRLVE